MELYDIVIVGAGPAGISAALFAKGDCLKFKLVENSIPCGFVEEAINTNFTNLENYLGLYNLNGTEVAEKFRGHLKEQNIFANQENLSGLVDNGTCFDVSTAEGKRYFAKTLILATGTQPKNIYCKGIDLISKKVHYSLNRNTPDYMHREVLIIGGRNSGCVTAIRLKEKGAIPSIIERSEKTSAKQKYLDKVHELEIPYFLNSRLEEIFNEGAVLRARLNVDGKERIFTPEAIFGCVGADPNNELAKKLNLSLDKEGYLIVDRQMRTSNQRVFAAGDITGGVKMIIVAAGEGAIAEYYANQFIKNKS